MTKFQCAGSLSCRRSISFLFSILFLFVQIIAIQAQPGDGALDPTFNASVTEGTGYVDDSVVQPDGKIIIAGIFHRVNGTKINGIARLNADGSLDATFNAGTGPNATIRTLALQPDGKILVGGHFTSFNNQSVSRIVRLNADGSRDQTFNLTVNFNSQVNDIVVLPDGKFLVGGAFGISSAPPSGTLCRLALLNNDGTFISVVSEITATVFKLFVQPDGKILVGTSSSLGGIRRLNADLTPDSGFNVGTGTDLSVNDIAVQPDGKIIFGGPFTDINGTATDGLVRVNSNGSLDTTFDYLSNEDARDNEVQALALQPDGKILTSSFQLNDVGNGGSVRRFNTDGTLDGTFSSGNFGASYAYGLTVLSDGSFLVGGAFVSYNNQIRLHFVKLNPNGGFDNSFNTAVSVTATIRQVKSFPDGKILIAGDFALVNGVPRRGIARLNENGTLDNSFNQGPGFDGTVYTFALQPDGKIIAGGLFGSYNNNPAGCLARLNADGSFDINLHPDQQSVILGLVYAVDVQPDGKILASGNIIRLSPGGVPLAIRINPNGELDASFNPPLVGNGFPLLIASQPSGKIVVAGSFTNRFPTFLRSGAARLNSDGSLDDSGWLGNGCCYTAMKQRPDGSIYLGFTGVSQYTENGDLMGSFTGFDNTIQAMEVLPDGKLLLGGFFTTYNLLPVNHILRVNSNGGLDQTFDRSTGTTGLIFALNQQGNGKVLVGGNFTDYNGVEKFSLVRLGTTLKKAPYDFDGDGKTDVGVWRAPSGSWWYLQSSDLSGHGHSFGLPDDIITPGDYTGDGKADVAIYRPSTGEWFVRRSEDGSYYSYPFGLPGDIPAPGDYDGDGKTDTATFRPSNQTWYIFNSGSGTFGILTFGLDGDKPVPADFDGDGKADIAVWRPSNGTWWIVNSSNLQQRGYGFGLGSDKPVVGDYTGDGKADIAVWRDSTREWFFLRSEDNSYYSYPFGLPGDIPVPGDYDGDGVFDAATFRPSSVNWFINGSTAGIMIMSFGLDGDRPVASAYVP